MRRRVLLATVILFASAWSGRAAAQEERGGTDEAVRRLGDAFRGDSEIEQEEAIREAAGLADPRVVKGVAKGLRSKSLAVRIAAIEVLGANAHPDALKALQDVYWRDKSLRKDEELFALLLQEIGRHGDGSSVRVLADSPFDQLTLASGRARIMGLGRIRTKESLEALVALSRKASPVGRHGKVTSDWAGKFRDHMRTALAVLTGQDFRYSRTDWLAWWQKNRGTFAIAAERPQVDAEVSALWESYWGEPYYAEGGEPAAPRLVSPYGRVESPTKEQVDEAVTAIREAVRGKDPQYAVAVIEEHAGLVHPNVVRALAEGLQTKDPAVRIAATDALGWMKHPDALKQLHRLYRRNKDLSKDEEVFAHLLKAIGRHGEKSSIAVLSDSPYKGLTLAAGRARILGLANIRETAAVEELMKGMRLGGGNPRRSRRYGEPRFIDDFRLALAVLTGEDFGASKEAWEEWWRKAKRGFRVERARPAIAQPLRSAWEAYWDEPY